MTCRGIGTTQRLSLNIREHWRFLSQRRWKLIRVNRGDWRSMGHAAVRFLNRLNRQRCGCALTRRGMDMRKVGRRCLWRRDRVMWKAFAHLLLIFGVRSRLIAPLTMSSPFRKRCCGRLDYDNNPSCYLGIYLSEKPGSIYTTNRRGWKTSPIEKNYFRVSAFKKTIIPINLYL